jgi:hypothetical protein
MFGIITNPSTAAADNPLLFSEATAEDEMALFTAANGWTLELEAGIVTADDYLDAVLIGVAGILAIEDGGFSMISNTIGLTAADFKPVTSANGTGHDITFVGTVEFPSGDSPWDFADQSKFQLNIVPEPTYLAVWGALAGIVWVTSRRRSVM